MDHYVGIGVSLEASSICVINASGKIVQEAKVLSELDPLIVFLRSLGSQLTRIGLEAGPLSQWIYAGLKSEGFSVELLETNTENTDSHFAHPRKNAVQALFTLRGSIGVCRWSRILTARTCSADFAEWRAGLLQGSDWYRGGMRQHLNCVYVHRRAPVSPVIIDVIFVRVIF